MQYPQPYTLCNEPYICMYAGFAAQYNFKKLWTLLLTLPTSPHSSSLGHRHDWPPRSCARYTSSILAGLAHFVALVASARTSVVVRLVLLEIVIVIGTHLGIAIVTMRLSIYTQR